MCSFVQRQNFSRLEHFAENTAEFIGRGGFIDLEFTLAGGAEH